MAFTLDSTLGQIIDNPQAKALMDQYMPGLSTNPMLVMAKGMSLNQVLAMPQVAQLGITKDKVEMLLTEINKRV
jgi:hypothetical protein